MEAADSNCVYGVLYALSAAARTALDAIEGVGNGYYAENLEIPGFGPAFCYLAELSHRDARLKPYTWYRDLIVAGARSRGFPTAYVQTLEAIPAVTDPDLRRDREHRALWECSDSG
jgi:gamma-glutamylcyclotransferase